MVAAFVVDRRAPEVEAERLVQHAGGVGDRRFFSGDFQRLRRFGVKREAELMRREERTLRKRAVVDVLKNVEADDVLGARFRVELREVGERETVERKVKLDGRLRRGVREVGAREKLLRRDDDAVFQERRV